MLFRRLLPALLLLTFFQTAFAQQTEPAKPNAVSDELRKEAVVFLRETGAEVGTLRSLENRISFASEMAGLMWFYDEKEAGAMYNAVITDFKQLLADYDVRMTAMNLTPKESEYRANLFGGNSDDKTQLTQKFFKAVGVRQQIAMSLAEHNPDLAFNFYYDTLSLISNPELRKMVEQRDASFESQLIRQIAAKDPAKAVEFGRRSIAKGIGWTHVDLLRQIYEKDAAKGAEFAAEIVSKFKSDKVSASNIYNVSAFLETGAANSESVKKQSGKKPMFTEQNLRDLAEILAQNILDKKDAAEISPSYFVLIEKYAPNRMVQISAKFPNLVKPKPLTASVVPITPGRVATVKPAARVEVETIMTSDDENEDKTRKEQEETMKNVMKLSSKELPKEEREKIIAQARKIIGGMGNKSEKIMALSMLASQVAAAGDKELASEVMKDAQTLVNPEPKNFRDYLEMWFLVSAFANADPEKAFPILEDAIPRLNETLSAFIKVGEFIDVSGEMIDDGEVQVGAFGGSMMSGLTRELGVANLTVRQLAIADFTKTKNLTNKFDRTEVRILAKMLVLRAVLGDEAKNPLKPEDVLFDEQ
jgi:hypothetical protein